MKLSGRLIVVSLSCVVVSACHLGGLLPAKAPTGQVAAVVDGHEVTLLELRAELAGVNLPNDKARKTAEQAALRAVVTRKLIADAARKQGLDKTPDFALQKQRAEDALLAQALQAKVVNETPAPTRDEALHFVEDHPNIFAERKIFTVDQIRMARPSDPALVQALQPLNTLDEVEAFLKKSNIEYRRGTGVLDAVGADPRLIDAVVKLPATELFVIPSGDALLVNHISDTRIEPFIGEPAVKYALLVLGNEHKQDAVSKQFSQIMTSGASSIQYNKDFRPAAAPAADQAPAPAH
jgi:EpsD family peptidyl-prolyl cis-trans isomerase